MRLKGKVAVVTGGSRGIGKALAILLSREGASVAIAARAKKNIDDVADLIKKSGGSAVGVEADVSRPDDVKNLMKKTLDMFGRIDILINNAGVCVRKNIAETSEREWDETIGTNLKGVFLCCREAVPVMIKQKSGIIINISSGAGRYGFPGLSAYCASKFGVIGLTESLSREFPERIKAYAACPGGVDTEMHRRVFPEDDTSALDSPEDVAKKIVELCMPDCKIKSGEVVELY